MEYINDLVSWLIGLGYLGIFLGLIIEVIPSEIVLGFGGYLVSTGRVTFAGAVLIGVIGGVIAQLFLYWLGLYGGRPFIERYGKYIFIKDKHLKISELWFEKYGKGMVFAARFVPIIRHMISIPAGIAKMNIRSYILLTALAAIPWSIFFIWLGDRLGTHWDRIQEVAAPYMLRIGIATVILVMLYFAWGWVIKKI